MGSDDAGSSKENAEQSPSPRCARCRVLFPAPGSPVCNYCALRASDPDALGHADVEEAPRDLAKEDRNATKVVEFALGLAWVLLLGAAFVAVYGIGPNFAPVSAAADTAYQGFVVIGSLTVLALVRPVKTRFLRWVEKGEQERGQDIHASTDAPGGDGPRPQS